jgi:colanic acid/amylovoran biosynthesis glycosyltransferase
MRIAFLVHRFPELSQTFILNQMTGLLAAGHEVDVYAQRPADGSTVHEDVHRYRLLERTRYWDTPERRLVRGLAMARLLGQCAWRRPRMLLRALQGRGRGLSPGLLRASLRFLEEKPYDILHCQFGTLGQTALALQDLGPVARRLVVSFRGLDVTKKRWVPSGRNIFRAGDLFLPVCERLKEELIRQGCDPRKTQVHHSGIKLSRFAYQERRRAVGAPTNVLTIGRLVEKKGVAYAIQAVARVTASGRPVRYTVVGDGPLKDELDRMIDALGLRAVVELAGPKSQEHVIALLRDAHLVVAPSVTAEGGDQEGIPNVLKEAMAMGIPVISTRHSGIPELVDDDVSGLLVPERDGDALADGLVRLIDHPERWGPMGRAGRARVEAGFDSEKLNDRLAELYQHVLGAPR